MQKICANASAEELTTAFLEEMADYLIFAMDKEERKQKNILTENRMITINRRETSYQGLAEKLENGEDGIYNMISTLGKNTIFAPKVEITEKDVEVVPGLKELRQEIAKTEKLFKQAQGRKKYLLKKQLIEMRQDQYVLKNEYYKPLTSNISNSLNAYGQTAEAEPHITITENGDVKSDNPISLYDPKHISLLLCNYSRLKAENYGDFNNDIYYIMQDLDALIDETLKINYPMLYSLLYAKIDGLSNLEIQQMLKEKFNISHSIEYISSLWRNKIPKLLAEQNQKKYLIWYYTNKEPDKAVWKICTKCGQKKLANNKFFSRNNDSKDGWYSICKECRNKKNKV